MNYPRQNGFTLVELLLAVTITVLVAGSAMLVFTSTAGAQQRIEHQMSLQQEARAAADAITTALRNVYRPNAEQDQTLFEGADDTIGDAPADRIRFMTVSDRTIRLDQPESDAREVEFYLEPMDRSESVFVLMRRTDPTRNVEPDGGGVVERIAANVAAFDVEYYDGVAWRQRWPRELNSLPIAVRINLLAVSNGLPQKVWKETRLIGYPRPSQAQEQTPQQPLEQEPMD